MMNRSAYDRLIVERLALDEKIHCKLELRQVRVDLIAGCLKAAIIPQELMVLIDRQRRTSGPDHRGHEFELLTPTNLRMMAKNKPKQRCSRAETPNQKERLIDVHRHGLRPREQMKTI
ncbi:MAG: hypothetical protein RIB46_07140 [Pseudomonadales bacterium]